MIDNSRKIKSNPSPKPKFSLKEKEKYEDPIFNTYGEIKENTICLDSENFFQEVNKKLSEEVRIYLIDQSGSMDLPFKKTTRMEYAKEVLKQEIEKLTKDSETNKVKNLGVYSFGSSFCNCIDVIHHFNEEISKEELFEKIAKLEPEGGTPI